MAKNACKCKKSEECEECPEWIFTFADLVMLMMGFFVILWVLKPPPGKDGEAQQALPKEVVAEIKEAFGYIPAPDSQDPIDQIILMKMLKGPGNGGKTTIPRQGAEGTDPEVMNVRQGSQAIVGSRVLFAVGDATLSPEANKILDQIVMLIKGHRNLILVRGHTSLDDFPESATPQQKMDLSIRRAKVVADYLVAHGVEPEILGVLARSTFEPVVQRAYTPEARQLNRRVEVESTTTLVAELQDKPEPAKPAAQSTVGESGGDVAAPKTAPAGGEGGR